MITLFQEKPCLVQKEKIQGHPVKVTALCSIAETVAAERYEHIGEIVAIAKEFGARRWDVLEALNAGIYEQRRIEIQRRTRHANTN